MFFCHTGDSFLGGLEIACLSLEDSVMGTAIVPSFLEGGGRRGFRPIRTRLPGEDLGAAQFFCPFWKRCVWSHRAQQILGNNRVRLRVFFFNWAGQTDHILPI